MFGLALNKSLKCLAITGCRELSNTATKENVVTTDRSLKEVQIFSAKCDKVLVSCVTGIYQCCFPY